MTRHSALDWPKEWLSAVPVTSWDTPHCETPELVETILTSRPVKVGLQVRGLDEGLLGKGVLLEEEWLGCQ
jgi:hypothetical protein